MPRLNHVLKAIEAKRGNATDIRSKIDHLGHKIDSLVEPLTTGISKLLSRDAEQQLTEEFKLLEPANYEQHILLAIKEFLALEG